MLPNGRESFCLWVEFASGEAIENKLIFRHFWFYSFSHVATGDTYYIPTKWVLVIYVVGVVSANSFNGRCSRCCLRQLGSEGTIGGLKVFPRVSHFRQYSQPNNFLRRKVAVRLVAKFFGPIVWVMLWFSMGKPIATVKDDFTWDVESVILPMFHKLNFGTRYCLRK